MNYNVKETRRIQTKIKYNIRTLAQQNGARKKAFIKQFFFVVCFSVSHFQIFSSYCH